MVQFIEMYSLIFTWIVWFIFFLNENSVLPILIEKNVKNNLLLFLENEVNYFQRREIQFFSIKLE